MPGIDIQKTQKVTSPKRKVQETSIETIETQEVKKTVKRVKITTPPKVRQSSPQEKPSTSGFQVKKRRKTAIWEHLVENKRHRAAKKEIAERKRTENATGRFVRNVTKQVGKQARSSGVWTEINKKRNVKKSGVFQLMNSGTQHCTAANRLGVRLRTAMTKAETINPAARTEFYLCEKWIAGSNNAAFTELNKRLKKVKTQNWHMDEPVYSSADVEKSLYKDANTLSFSHELVGLFPIYRVSKGEESKSLNLTTMHAGMLLVIPRPGTDKRIMGNKVPFPGSNAPHEAYYYEPFLAEAESWTGKKGKNMPKQIPHILKQFGIESVYLIRGTQTLHQKVCTDRVVNFAYTILVGGISGLPKWKEASEEFRFG